MERAYIDELNHAYDAFYLEPSGGHRTPVLVVETDNLNYVRSADDLHWIAERIQRELKVAPYQPKLLAD